MSIIDLSLPIDNECQTCGTSWHERVVIEKKGTLETVGRNTSRIVLGSHSATHMDAPLHFINGAHGVDKNDLNICVGPVSCVDFRNIGVRGIVSLNDVRNLKITSRMLFVFGWFKNWKTNEFYKDFPYFSAEAITFLIEQGMKLMALDTPSPDTGSAINEKDDSPNHKILLHSDVIIVEYLCNTDKINFNKKYEIIALPLKILDCDGSPSRVILRELV